MRRRVVITGAGVVSPLGAGVETFWDALAGGRSGVDVLEIEAVGAIPAFPVAEGEDARERFGQRDARRMDRSGRLAAVAAALALEDAGDPDAPAERVGVSIGSVHGGRRDPAGGPPGPPRARRRPRRPARHPVLAAQPPLRGGGPGARAARALERARHGLRGRLRRHRRRRSR